MFRMSVRIIERKILDFKERANVYKNKQACNQRLRT